MTWSSFFDGLVRWLCKAIRRMKKHTAEGAALFRPTGFEHVPIILWRNTSVASRMICRTRGAIHPHPPPKPDEPEPKRQSLRGAQRRGNPDNFIKGLLNGWIAALRSQ